MLVVCCLAGCSDATPAVQISTSTLTELSCAADTAVYEAAPLDISLTAVQLGLAANITKTLPSSVKFIKGLHLTSTESEFGGLSGLEVLPNGDLLAVSDKGYFLTLDPNGKKRATIMPLLDATGKSLTGKTKGDAEGLAYKDGLAFVSFERKHRVLAYNLERCGVAARGISFAGSPEAVLQTKLGANDGAEALDVSLEGRIRAGYETIIDGRTPLITFEEDGTVFGAVDYVSVEPDFKLVGADEGFLLFRAYDRKAGNRNIIRGPSIEFQLAPPLNVDNFEGIAVEKLENGITRLYLVSDDNFSARQRTLLYVFEIRD